MSLILYAGSYVFLSLFKRLDIEEEFLPNCWDDQIVYKTSFFLCAFSMAVSVGAALLLPISTISNEILHKYPSSWYIKWLNASLIHGIWNLIFVLSNLSLFVCLPFAYLFCESEGLQFFGNKKGLLARAKETIVTLILFSLIILGMMYIIAALLDRDKDSIERILNVYSYLPFLYSCVSFLGVLMLLICTPIGFARLFTIVGDLVIKPTFMRNLEEEFYQAKFEEDSLRHKLNVHMQQLQLPIDSQSIPLSPLRNTTGNRLKNGQLMSYYQRNLSAISDKRENLAHACNARVWTRILGYPLIMISLLLLTSISLICVVNNVGQIIAGFRSLPLGQNTVDLGMTSLSALGVLGVVIEVLQIGYLFLTSLVGLYTIPLIRRIRPEIGKTSLTHLILNCGLCVVLSSALPLLCKILGISNFDLLGSFSEVKWLGNLYIILFYNAVFAVSASLCLFNKFTARVRQEIFRRLSLYFSTFIERKGLSVVTTPVTAVAYGSLKTE
ncbi:limb region 1 protein homolog isoform X2 [Lepeophtheirus salmonis]|nr:protein Lilipod-like isoform X2 [Lepeophtheirus salmonis]